MHPSQETQTSPEASSEGLNHHAGMFVVSNLQGGNSIVEIFSAFCWKYVDAFAIFGPV